MFGNPMLSVARISGRISILATSSVVPSALVPTIVPLALKKKILVQSRPEKYDCDGLYDLLPKRGVMDVHATTFVGQHRKHASLAIATI